MSASTRPPGSALSLHGAPNSTESDNTESASSRSAILVRLNEQIIRDLQQCSQAGKAVQLLGGKTPRIRYGAKLLELSVKPETFRHEIYSTEDTSSGQLGFAGLVSHSAEIKLPAEKAQDGDASADAALAALKQSLASMAKQKEDRKATIVSNTAKSYNTSRPNLSLHNRNPSASTPRLLAPTSAPSDPQTKAREKGMRFALIHLLAIKPASEQQIHDKTHIPKIHLSNLLPKFADKSGSEWELFNKSYKELDPWTFKYTSQQRQTAIDNAIRAFDRQRVPKDDKAWQILLPKEERGKGKVLSRLNLGAERKDQQLGTPGLAPTPVHIADKPAVSAATTPKLGSTGTPRGAATATGRSAAGISIEKRLKEAKKKGALEKKKQEKEAKDAAAIASDRESKPRTMVKKAPPPKRLPAKVKSDEVVHSSDDEEEGEVKETVKTTKPVDAPRNEPPKPAPKPRPAPERRDSSASEVSRTSKESVQMKPRPKSATTSAMVKKDSVVSKPKAEPAKASQTGSVAARKPDNVAAAKASARPRDSPLQQAVKPVTAVHKSTPMQVSPRKNDTTKPKVPSPLGTSPPRNASDRLDKPAKPAPPKVNKPSTSVTVGKLTKPSASAKAADTPVSFFGNDVKSVTKTKIVTKKRALDTDNDAPEPTRKIMRPGASSAAKPLSSTTTTTKSTVNGTAGTKNGTTKSSTTTSAAARPVANTDKTLKRKANELSSGVHDHGAPVAKHRKTDSGSTHSHAPTNSSVASLTTAPTISPVPSSPSQSDSSRDEYFANILDDEYDGGVLTWEQARGAADWFRTKMYPAYLELYKRIENTPSEKVQEEEKSRLWALHHRLEAVKHRIEVACGSGEN